MAYKITIEVPDKGAIAPWYDIFEKGCCASCPNNGYNADKNQSVCWIMGMALPVGHDHDQHPWKLCPVVGVEYIDKDIPIEMEGQKWLRPGIEEDDEWM